MKIPDRDPYNLYYVLSKLLLIAMLLGCKWLCHAQQVNICVLQQGTAFTDSSYYDIMPISDSIYWIGGKYGTLKTINAAGNLTTVEYPSQQVDIYKMDKFDAQNLIACGDKGVIYHHNLRTKSWQTLKIKGYENACFYNMCVVDATTAFVCGGSSAIAHSKKTIPKGFILKSTDRGQTWTKVYGNALKMVWCVKQNPYNGQVYALMYTPNRTHLYAYEGDRWVKKEKIGNSIFHEVQFENQYDYMAMGGWIGKKGRLRTRYHKQVFEDTGLIWSKVSGPEYDLYTACNGKMILDDRYGNREVIGVKLNDKFSIYEAVFTSSNTAIAIGTAQTILMIKVLPAVMLTAKP